MDDIRVVIKGFAGDLKRAVRDARGDIRSLARETRQANATTRAGSRDVDVYRRGLLGLDGALGKVNRSMTFFRNIGKLIKWPALIAGVGLLTKEVGALSAAALGLVGSLEPLTGLLVAYPSVLSALGQGMLTWKLGIGEVTKALKGNEQALKRLSPMQRDFVQQLKDLKPLYRELQDTAGKGLIGGASKGLKSALGNFGSLKKVVGETGDAIGGLLERTGKLLGSKAFGKDFETIGARNAKTISRLGGAGLYLASAMRHVLVAADPFLDWLTKGTEHVAKLIDQEAKAGRESGRLAHFFDGTKKSLKLLWPFLRDSAGALLNITAAAKPLGDSILRELGKAAAGWKSWTESVEGQNALAEYFRQAKPVIFETGRLVGDLVKALVRLSDPAGTTPLVRQLRTELIPALEQLIHQTTQAFGPHIIALVVSLAKTLAVLTGPTGALTVMTDLLKIASDALRALLQAPGLGTFATNMIAVAGVWKGLKWAGALKAAEGLAKWWKVIRGEATATAALSGAGAAGAAKGAAKGAATGAVGGSLAAELAAARTATKGKSALGGLGKALGPAAKLAGKAFIGIALAQGAIEGFTADFTTKGGKLAQGIHGALLGLTPNIKKEAKASIEAALRDIGKTGGFGQTKIKRSFLGIDVLSRDSNGLKLVAGSIKRELRELAARVTAFRAGKGSFEGIRKDLSRFVAAHPQFAGAVRGMARELQSFNRVANSKYTILRFGVELAKNKQPVKQVIDQMLKETERLPKGVRLAALRTALGMARELRSKGKLSKDAMKNIRVALIKEMDRARSGTTRKSEQLSHDVQVQLKLLQQAIQRGIGDTISNVNQSLSLLGLKPLSFKKGKPQIGGKNVKPLKDLQSLRASGGYADPQAAGSGYVGRQGERGRDTRVIRVGAGEAILNEPEQGVVNQALAETGRGHLRDVFRQHATTKHSRATGIPRREGGGFVEPERFEKGGGVGGMVAAANRLDRAHFPYQLGGGHQGSPAPFGPMDCSGAVSYVLQHGGVHIPTMVSGALAGAGKPGAGRVTVYANAGHAYMSIDGRFFGTSGQNPGGGAGWFPGSPRPGFAVRHFKGDGDGGLFDGELPREMIEGGPAGLRVIGQKALDIVRDRGQDYIDSQAPIGTGDVGEFAGMGGTARQNMALGKQMAAERGWTGPSWTALRKLWEKESGWLPKTNPKSGAYGIPQALGHGHPFDIDDIPGQIKWGLDYIAGRYGNPLGAWAHSMATGWYGKGGVVAAAGIPSVGDIKDARGTVIDLKGKTGDAAKLAKKKPTKANKHKLAEDRKKLAAARRRLAALRKQRKRRKRAYRRLRDAGWPSGALAKFNTDLKGMEDVDTTYGLAEGAYQLNSSQAGSEFSPRETADLLRHGSWGRENALASYVDLFHRAKDRIYPKMGKAIKRTDALGDRYADQARGTLRHANRYERGIHKLEARLKKAKGKKAKEDLRARLRYARKHLKKDRSSLRFLTGKSRPKTLKEGKVGGILGAAFAQEAQERTDRGEFFDTNLRPGGLPSTIFAVVQQIDALKGAKDSTTADPSDSGLSDSLREQLSQTRESLRLQAGMLEGLRGFAPMVGRYKHGGPIVEDGLAYVHRGERVIPEPDGPYRNRVAEGRGGDGGTVEVVLALDEKGLLRIIDQRAKGAAAKVSVSTGQRQRRIQRAPGR